MDQLSDALKPLLSAEASIQTEVSARWSTYHAPRPQIAVSVATEADVANVVKYCAEHNIKFLSQSGGSAWAKFSLSDGVTIDLAALSQITLNVDKTEATVGGGVTVKQAIDAADSAGVFLMTGNCNCVGLLGAILGGGYGNLLGQYGFGVDNVLSLRLVTADGNILTVTPESHSDLFWAVRGAGPNFGIVTSAVLKAYPVIDRTAWNMALIFTPNKIKQVVQAVEDLRSTLLATQAVYLYLTNSGPPDNQPVILVTGFLLQATAEQGRAAFSGIYAFGPVFEKSGVLPYTQWNTAADAFCSRKQRKPGHTTGISKLYPDKWPEIWDLYVSFRSKPGAENSVIIIETYNLAKARSIPHGSSAFAHRKVNAQAVIMPWYTDSSLDAEAIVFAKKIRGILEATEEKKTAYVNFAHGDEGLEDLYGDSLPRLRELKSCWDPHQHFRHWFNIH